MTPEDEKLAICGLEFLGRIALALEKIAEIKSPRQAKNPAVLSTATYSQEERDKAELRKVMADGIKSRQAG